MQWLNLAIRETGSRSCMRKLACNSQIQPLYMKKENSIQFATVQMVIDGKESKHSVKYISLERLSKSVFDLVLGKHCEPDNIILTLADGRSYRWCYDMAHYCFAKQRVSVEDFVKFQFVEEERV